MLLKSKSMVLTFVLVAISAGVAHAVSVAWVKRYAGSGAKIDVASGVATDSGGNIYVTGWSQGATSDYDFVTIKYSATGVQKWVQRYNGPGNGSDKAFAMAVDRYGNVYVTGPSWGGTTTRYDWATIKYNTNGNRLWVRRYEPEYGGGYSASLTYPSAIVVDGSGSTYITGIHENPEWEDMPILKYDTNGNLSWERHFAYAHSGIGMAIALDKSTNVYAAGSGGGVDVAGSITVKCSNNGAVFWSKIFPPDEDHPPDPGIPDTYAWAGASDMAIDTYGNVYLIGYYDDQTDQDQNSNYFITKYNNIGTQLWVRFYNGIGNDNDYGKKIAVDRTGNIYVTGKSFSGTASGYDFVTVKYNTLGTQQWARRYAGPGAGEDEPTGITLDGAGNVYITGILSMGSTTSEDWATIKYNPQGSLLWSQRFNGPAKLNDRAKAITLDGQGNVYVTGHSYQQTTGYDYNTIKYVQ